MDALYGTLPGTEQTVPRAEMWAVCETLRRAILPICIHTDHMAIVKGLEAGKPWTTKPGRLNADLWSSIWHHIEDLGGLGPNLQVKWVPGHDDGDHEEAAGNRYADTYAKMGAALHEVDLEVLSAAKEVRDKQRAVAKWIGLAAAEAANGPVPHRTPKAEWPKRTQEDRRRLARERSSYEAGTGRWPNGKRDRPQQGPRFPWVRAVRQKLTDKAEQTEAHQTMMRAMAATPTERAALPSVEVAPPVAGTEVATTPEAARRRPRPAHLTSEHLSENVRKLRLFENP